MLKNACTSKKFEIEGIWKNGLYKRKIIIFKYAKMHRYKPIENLSRNWQIIRFDRFGNSTLYKSYYIIR